MSSLNVYIDTVLVGVLREQEDLWQFEYDAKWITATQGYDLAPGLSRAQGKHIDGSTTRPVQWYFDNLLPEEMLRQAIEKEAGVKGADAFALLEYLGAESAGSLTLLPPDTLPGGKPSIRELSDQTLSQRIADLPIRTLAARAPKRMSLAGAQHKLLVVYQDGRLYEPEGATASTHILKPNHPDKRAYPASVSNEYLAMRLARAAGLPTPNVHMRYVPQPVYIVNRFDRVVAQLGSEANGLPQIDVKRLHIIDACQLLNRSRVFKYNGASLEALNEIINKTTNKLQTRTRLFRWLVFNVLVANDDCHLKNLSFFVAADGVRLTEHYDLLSTGAYYTKAIAQDNASWPNVRMAIALPGADSFGSVTKESILAAGEELGVPRPAAQRILAEVVSRVPSALKKERDALEKRHAALAAEAKLFAGMEVRLLSVLENIIVKDMLANLAR
ncbi:HipA domain-containing protein [Janthinobacterium sp. RB2R34]|uniref:HipA domain-containing protein n=1 Tax=Janthinobacterium sp. RB2R34 TaxID=3424193 RepID=UPI003F27F13E